MTIREGLVDVRIVEVAWERRSELGWVVRLIHVYAERRKEDVGRVEAPSVRSWGYGECHLSISAGVILVRSGLRVLWRWRCLDVMACSEGVDKMCVWVWS